VKNPKKSGRILNRPSRVFFVSFLCGARPALRQAQGEQGSCPAISRTRRCALPIRRETVFRLRGFPGVLAR
jgi:hypothetical protein